MSRRILNREDAKEEMSAWFLERYKNPADGVPYESAEGVISMVAHMMPVRSCLMNLGVHTLNISSMKWLKNSNPKRPNG